MKEVAFQLFIIFILFPALLMGENVNAIRTDTPPKIDGILDDPLWKTTPGYSQFVSFSPEYGKPPKEETTVYMAYDADNLYFAFKCNDKEPQKVVATLFKRDETNRDENVMVFLDSRNNGQNAYFFKTNPLGIQIDGIMDSGGYLDKAQDFVWESAGQKTVDGFTVEIRVPFQSIRFTKARRVTMRVGFMRKIIRYSEQYSFPGLPVGEGSMVDQLALVELENINSKRVFEILPSITYMDRRQRDSNDKMVSTEDKKINIGFSAKLGLTSDMTMDMTWKPDYSHIEVDEGQVDVNLRIKTLRVEKRPFFLEGMEHFVFAGTGDFSPLSLVFHSRNIKAPLLGLKVSGKAGKSGILNSLFVIDDEEESTTPSAALATETPTKKYYGILRYKQTLGRDSFVGGLYTAKEYKGGYYRLGGLDSKIRLTRNTSFNGYFLYSFKQESEAFEAQKGSAFGFKLFYDTLKNVAILGYDDLETSFNLDIGRLARANVRSFSAYVDRSFFTTSDLLKRIILSYTGVINNDKDYQMNDYSHRMAIQFDFPSSSTFSLSYDVAKEIVDGFLFDRNQLSLNTKLQLTKYFFFQCDFSTGGWPNYLYPEMGNGKERSLTIVMQFQPSPKFYSVFSYKNRIYHDQSSGEKLYDFSIYRNKTIFQPNRYFSFRTIVEYSTETKKMICDALAEFTYIPGTVIHLGYGPTFRQYSVNDTVYPYDRLRLIGSAFFFKASYLFRF